MHQKQRCGSGFWHHKGTVSKIRRRASCKVAVCAARGACGRRRRLRRWQHRSGGCPRSFSQTHRAINGFRSFENNNNHNTATAIEANQPLGPHRREPTTPPPILHIEILTHPRPRCETTPRREGRLKAGRCYSCPRVIVWSDVSSESGADDGLSLGKGGVEKFRVVTDAVDV